MLLSILLRLKTNYFVERWGPHRTFVLMGSNCRSDQSHGLCFVTCNYMWCMYLEKHIIISLPSLSWFFSFFLLVWEVKSQFWDLKRRVARDTLGPSKPQSLISTRGFVGPAIPLQSNTLHEKERPFCASPPPDYAVPPRLFNLSFIGCGLRHVFCFFLIKRYSLKLWGKENIVTYKTRGLVYNCI